MITTNNGFRYKLVVLGNAVFLESANPEAFISSFGYILPLRRGWFGVNLNVSGGGYLHKTVKGIAQAVNVLELWADDQVEHEDEYWQEVQDKVEAIRAGFTG